MNFEPQLVLEYSLDSERQNILHSKYVVVPPIYSEVKVVSQNFIRTTVRLDQDFGFSQNLPNPLYKKKRTHQQTLDQDQVMSKLLDF